MRCGFRHKGCSVCDEALLLCDEALANWALCSSCSSFRRKPESNVFTLCWSFPRRRESSSCCFGFFRARASTRLWRAGSFLCSCKERNQRNTPQRLAPIGHRAQWVRASGRIPLIAHPVQQRNRRDPSRRPLRGLIARCRRKAMGPPGRARARASCAQKQKTEQSRFCSGRCSGSWAPSAAARAGRNRPQGRAQGCARVREWAGCPSSEPRPDLAHPQREARRARLPGCVLFGYFLLHKQEKVTRSHGCERKNEGTRSEQNQKPQQKLDSSLRWNDELERRHWIPASAGMTS